MKASAFTNSDIQVTVWMQEMLVSYIPIMQEMAPSLRCTHMAAQAGRQVQQAGVSE